MYEWYLLFLSVVCWNTAFFGNALTCWLVIPSLIFWIALIISISQAKFKKTWWKAFIFGLIWGAACLAPQFWWLARAPHIYPNCYVLAQGYGFFALFLVLFSLTHAFFTLLQVFICHFFRAFKWSSTIRALAAATMLIPYFFYLVNFGFAPLGVIQGYPFFWPFLPLAKSKTFLKSLSSIKCKTSPQIIKKISQTDFRQLDKKLCARFDAKRGSSFYSGQKIRTALKCESSKIHNTEKTLVFLAPECAFPHPLNIKYGYINTWGESIPKNSHFIVGTRRQIAPKGTVTMNWVQKIMLNDNEQLVATGCCQAVGWIHNKKLEKLIDKKTVCPFTEEGILKGENQNYDRVNIGPLSLVPIVCYDFFSNFSWMKTVDSENEVTVLLANESWFPEQTSNIIQCFVRFSSAWHGKPIVYVSAKYGLELVSYSGAFDKTKA